MQTAKTYVLKHNRLITYLVLIFSDLNKAQIFKMLYRDSAHHEIVKVMSLKYLELLKPDELTEDYHNRGPNYKNFVIEIEDIKYIYVGESLVNFQTSDKIVENFPKEGFNDINYPNVYSKGIIYFMLHRIYIPIEEYKISAQKNDIEYLYKKMMN